MPANKLFDVEAIHQPKGVGRTLTCVSCGLYKDVLSPKMPPFGKFGKRVMLIGEGPGETEDRVGKPWQGKAGQTLQDALKEAAGLDLVQDCLSLNTVACRPPKNRTPTPHEMACCRAKFVQPAINDERPSVIILFGGSPTKSVLGPIYPDVDERITKWRGFRIPIPEWGAWVCPTFHPSYIMREEEKNKVVRTIWLQDIKNAANLIGTSVPEPENLRDSVTILRTEDEIVTALKRVLRREGYFTFDYETTGIRAKVQKLVCASFCQHPSRSYAFMFRDSETVDELWRQIMLDEGIKKISHNLKFENEWTIEHFDAPPVNWVWDSMQAAHVLDNRPGICGLKDQAFLNFGVGDYDRLISDYLKSTESKNPRAPNRIYEFIEKYGEDECLYYCGIDSLVTFRLAMKQMELINAP